jgi:hypothetical protein
MLKTIQLFFRGEKLMPEYKPTVYEQIVTDFLAGKNLNYDDYKDELSARGWSEKRYFDAYVKDMEFIKELMESPDFNLRVAADIVKKNHPSKDEDVLRFSLLDKEKKIVLAAEQRGMFKDGEVIEYEGYDKKIEAHDYLNLPEKADAFVIFSGHLVRQSRQLRRGLMIINVPERLKNWYS